MACHFQVGVALGSGAELAVAAMCGSDEVTLDESIFKCKYFDTRPSNVATSFSDVSDLQLSLLV